jgi:hypothetical protein
MSPINQFNMDQTSARTLLNSMTTFMRLQETTIAPGLGPIKTAISGRGNIFARKSGTIVKIFNTTLWASEADMTQANKLYEEGKLLELDGKFAEADRKFAEALNMRISFSVLTNRIHEFDAAYEVVGVVAKAISTKEGVAAGTEIFVLNNVRAIAVAEGKTTKGLWVAPELPSAKPEEPKEETPAETKARIAAEKKAAQQSK